MAEARLAHTEDEREVTRQSLLDILDAAKDVQKDFDSWTDALPEERKSRPLTTASGEFLVYDSEWMACVWALYHAALIIFYCRIISCCRQILHLNLLPSPSEREVVISTVSLASKACEGVINDIMTSIPFALGEIDKNCNKRTNKAAKAACGYLLTWPLAVVARCPFSTDEQAIFCDKTLRWIASTMGLRLASWAAKMLENFSFF